MNVKADLDPLALEQLRSLEVADPGVFQRLVEAFLRDAPKHIEALAETIKTGNFKEVSHAVHTLKGSAGNFGARRLMAWCDEVETCARRKNHPGTDLALSRLRGEYELVRAALEEMRAA